MRIEHKKVYITLDFKEFYDEELAKTHEEALLGDIRCFKLYTNPDLTEGRHGPRFKGFALVKVARLAESFLRYEMYRKFGPEYDFVMGVYDSGKLMQNWYVEDCTFDEVEWKNVVLKIEEQNEEKLWKDSINSTIGEDRTKGGCCDL